jgi:hypothetical protein
MQTWCKVADHLPPLTGKDPPEMIAGEEGDGEEEEDEGGRTESISEAFSQKAAGRARGAKRGRLPPRKHRGRKILRRRRRRPLRRKGGRPPTSLMSHRPSDCARPSWRVE